MRKMLLFVLLFPAAAVFSQTPITLNDVADIFAPGKAWISASNEDPQTTMDIGSASASSQNWVVPNIAWQDTFVAVNSSPSSTPFSSDFPTATYAQYTTGSLYGYTGTIYSYYQVDNNTLYSLGTVAQVKIGPIDTVIVSKNKTYLFTLPITFGATQQLSSDTTDVGGGLIYVSSTSQSVDAFGNITLPFGTFPALRIAEVEETTAYQNGSVIYQQTQSSFTWIAKGAGTFQADIDAGTGTSGTVSLTSAEITQYTTAPLAVNETGINTPSNFSLYQNYPNPFNPSTKIRFSIPASISTSADNLVTLKVYDMLGNEVATLVNGEKPAGTYEVEFSAKSIPGAGSLPSGIYFYRLTAGSFSQTQKMILLK
jgi:Secretion system C-terminal sorting domain